MTNARLKELAESAQVELAKRKCLTSTLFHAQYFFEKIKREQFIVNDHHKTICDALDMVFRGEITRLIINVAPRYTKTELGVKAFVQKGLAHNPKAKFIHLSYSDTLALDNSDSIREACKNPFYQQLFPNVHISRRSDSKKKWYTTDGGGIYATSAAGQVTGFGAGGVDQTEETVREDPDSDLSLLLSSITDLDEVYKKKEEQEHIPGWVDPLSEFAGALIIDDPIKPEDALSEVKRKRINDRFDSTIRNRVNSKKTPIIIIQQRVHQMDLTGYLLSIEPEKWVVIKLPCLQEDGTPLWSLKHTAEDLLHLKKISPFVFQCQYQQDPQAIKRGGEFYKLFEYKRNVIRNPRGPSGLPSLYDPDKALHVTYDFNVKPFLAIGIWQVFKTQFGKEAIKIDEVAARSPINRTEPASLEVARRYATHGAGMFVYGDPSGKKEDTKMEAGHNDFTIILKALKQFKPTLRLLSKAPPVAMRGNFMNTIFVDGFNGLEIFIGDNCVETINDYMHLLEDSDGTKLKEKVKDQEGGGTYEKLGHNSDGDEYFICMAFANEFVAYQRGVGGKLSVGKSTPSKNSY